MTSPLEMLIQPARKRAVESLNSDADKDFADPSQAEAIPLFVSLVEKITSPTTGRLFEPLDVSEWTIRAALGKILTPVAGIFTLTVSNGSTTETTNPLAYNATAAQIAAALNATALVTTAGGVTVESGAAGYFRILYNSAGNRPQITGDPSNLAPLSLIETGTLIEGAGLREVQIVRLMQNPAAYVVLEDDSPAAAVTIDVLTVGGSGENHKVRATLDPLPFDGKWTLKVATYETGFLAFDSSGADVEAALSGLIGIGAGNVEVSKEVAGRYLIGFKGSLANTNVGTIEGFSAGLRVVKGKTGLLDLRNPAVDLLLSGADSTQAFLLIEGTPPGGAPREIYRKSLNVLASLLVPSAVGPAPANNFYSKAQIDAMLSGGAGLPSTEAAGDGDVLTLHDGKVPGWLAPFRPETVSPGNLGFLYVGSDGNAGLQNVLAVPSDVWNAATDGQTLIKNSGVSGGFEFVAGIPVNGTGQNDAILMASPNGVGPEWVFTQLLPSVVGAGGGWVPTANGDGGIAWQAPAAGLPAGGIAGDVLQSDGEGGSGWAYRAQIPSTDGVEGGSALLFTSDGVVWGSVVADHAEWAFQIQSDVGHTDSARMAIDADGANYGLLVESSPGVLASVTASKYFGAGILPDSSGASSGQILTLESPGVPVWAYSPNPFPDTTDRMNQVLAVTPGGVDWVQPAIVVENSFANPASGQIVIPYKDDGGTLQALTVAGTVSDNADKWLAANEDGSGLVWRESPLYPGFPDPVISTITGGANTTGVTGGFSPTEVTNFTFINGILVSASL